MHVQCHTNTPRDAGGAGGDGTRWVLGADGGLYTGAADCRYARVSILSACVGTGATVVVPVLYTFNGTVVVAPGGLNAGWPTVDACWPVRVCNHCQLGHTHSTQRATQTRTRSVVDA
jgi:hypothetical protein